MDGKEIRNLTVACVLYSLSRSDTHRANAVADVRVAPIAIRRQAIRDRYGGFALIATIKVNRSRLKALGYLIKPFAACK